jgi:hypothetical protein
MAASGTFYRDAALTDDLSDGDWSDPLDLGTVNIPGAGSAYTAGAQVFIENDGTTDLTGIQISAVAGSGETDTAYDERVSFAPDSAGSPGAWGTDGDPYAPADLSSGGSAAFWVRTRADSADVQPANPVNFTLQLDATSV